MSCHQTTEKDKIFGKWNSNYIIDLLGLFLQSSNNDAAKIPDNTHARTKFPITFRSIDEGISQRTTTKQKPFIPTFICKYFTTLLVLANHSIEMFLCHSCRQGFDLHRCIPDGTFRTLPECQSKVNCCFGSPNYGSNHRLIKHFNEIRHD